MLTLRTNLKFRSRVVVKCEKHPRYNPEKDGPGAIRGGCSRCAYLYQIFNTWSKMKDALRDYQQMTVLYEQIKSREAKKQLPEPERTSVV